MADMIQPSQKVSAVISTRCTDEFLEQVDEHAKAKSMKRGELMLAALTEMLSGGSHAKFPAPTVPTPTEDERGGMRFKAFVLLAKGEEWTPEDAAQVLGCGSGAASAYFRDLRKPGYGAHKIISRQIIREGKRTSAYRLEVGNE